MTGWRVGRRPAWDRCDGSEIGFDTETLGEAAGSNPPGQLIVEERDGPGCTDGNGSESLRVQVEKSVSELAASRIAVENELGSAHRIDRGYLVDHAQEDFVKLLRFIVGPGRWMLLVYEYYEAEDRVVVLTIQDARSSNAVTHA